MTPAQAYDTAHAMRQRAKAEARNATTPGGFLAVLKLQIERDRLLRLVDIKNRGNFLNH